MSYQVHNFQTGEVIEAAPVNEMDAQIQQNEQDISGKADKTDTVLTSTLSRDRNPNYPAGDGSVAFGTRPTASGGYSQAFGYWTKASGLYASAFGNNTEANHRSQHVFGEYNRADNSGEAATARGNYIEIVGNGTSTFKSNARVLDWDGNMMIRGEMYVKCTPESTGGSKLARLTDIVPESKSFVYGMYDEVADINLMKYVTKMDNNKSFDTQGNEISVSGYCCTELMPANAGEYKFTCSRGTFSGNFSFQVHAYTDGVWQRRVKTETISSFPASVEFTLNSGENGIRMSFSNIIADIVVAKSTGVSAIDTVARTTKADKTDTVLLTTLSRGRKANTTVGDESLAFGYNVEASGEDSVAFGLSTKATADGTVAFGSGTEANHAVQFVFGRYNVPDPSTIPSSNVGTYAEIVGCGTSSSKKNARTLDWSGNERLKGTLYVGCNNDSTGGAEVATKFITETVTGSTPSITGVDNYKYVCGEVSTLSITAPQTGIIDVTFQSGTTATVLTTSGITWPAWFDPTDLEASATYEINVQDGLGAVMVWT